MFREYKGLDILIRSANDLKKKLNDFTIVVAGECYENKKIYYNLAKDLNVESKIRFDFNHIKKAPSAVRKQTTEARPFGRSQAPTARP